jgi:hypothetical protein
VLEGICEFFLIALIKTAMLLTFKLPMLSADQVLKQLLN